MDNADVTDKKLNKMFHESNSLGPDRLRSPVYIRMALLKAMYAEIQDARGAIELEAFLPKSQSVLFTRHASINRAYAALTIKLGQSPQNISETAALSTLSSPLLINCINKMVERRNA